MNWPILGFSAIAILSIGTHQAAAGELSKPAWRWTLQERLAIRNDRVAAAQRLREDASATSAGRIAPKATSDQVDVISGRKHPELLLPWEVFDQMMGMAFADDPEVRSIFREAQSSALAASGLPSDFWNKLAPISASYLSDVGQLRDLHKHSVADQQVRQRIARESSALEALKCHDRARAIEAARRDFGESFDRFLYQGVAPTMSMAIGPGGEANLAREQTIERGCQ